MANPSSTLVGSSTTQQGDIAMMNGDTTAPSTSTSLQPNGITNGNTPNGDAVPPVDPTQVLAARREEEIARRDRSLAEFLVMLDGYKPMVNSLKSCKPELAS
jgi:hypothetical protein